MNKKEKCMKKRPEIIVWTVTASIVFTMVVGMALLSYISSSEKWIGDYKISFVDFPNTVSISDYRGDGDVEVPSQIGPFKVVHISDSIFEENEEITSVYFLSDLNLDMSIDIYACPNLSKIEFAEGTAEIDLNVKYCDKLKELVIPEGVEEIDGQFYGCLSLDKIKFPSTLKRVSKRSFDESKFIEMHENDKYYMVGDSVLFYFGAYDEDIVIPQGTKCFDDSVYTTDSSKNIDQRNIYIPESVIILDIQTYDYDTVYLGNEDLEFLDLNCRLDGINGTIVAPANSYMEKYCKENGYNLRVMAAEEEKEWRSKTEAAASEITYQE